MKINYNHIVLCLFTCFSFLILALTIQVWYNNFQINKTIEMSYGQIDGPAVIKIKDILPLSEDGRISILSGKQKYVFIIDSTEFINKVDQIKEVKRELNESRRYILDANTITYLIQVICFFLIGLQLFISNKNEKETKEIENKFQILLKKTTFERKKLLIKTESDSKLTLKFLQINSLSSSIINHSEMISFYSTKLNQQLQEDATINTCFSISSRLINIIEIEEKFKNRQIEITTLAKSHSISLLYDVVKIFESKKYHDGEGYFKSIYDRLLKAINTIKNIPINDEFDTF